MKNKGIKIGVVFILLFALLSVAGCQYDDRRRSIGTAGAYKRAAAHWVYTVRIQRKQYSTVTGYYHQ